MAPGGEAALHAPTGWQQGRGLIAREPADRPSLGAALAEGRLPAAHGPDAALLAGALLNAARIAGALEAVSVLLSFEHRELPPTMGTAEVDPALELDVVLKPRAWEPGPTISNSFGFGGHNGFLILGPA